MVKGVSNIAGTYFLCPANSAYMPAPLQTFANLFSKWRMEDVCFEFVPRVVGGTSSGFYMTWGWSNDPIYPDDHSWNNVSGAGWQPYESQVAMLPNAKQFPAWIPQQCMRIKSDDSKWLYSIASEFNTPVVGSDVPADVRSQYPGVMAIAGNENSPNTSAASTTVLLGNIYVEGTFQFSELTSAITADPSVQEFDPSTLLKAVVTRPTVTGRVKERKTQPLTLDQVEQMIRQKYVFEPFEHKQHELAFRSKSPTPMSPLGK